MAEDKQYTLEELKEFYSPDKVKLVRLYAEQFKQCVDSYIKQDGLFHEFNQLREKTEKIISKRYGIKKSKVCMFVHCFDDNVRLLNGNITTDSDDHLYFIESDNYIKIGRSKDVKERIQALQTHNADTLKILFVKFNSGNNEKAIHRLFDYLRVSGEWFNKHEDIYNYIEALKQYANIPSEVQWDKGKVKHDFNYLMRDL